MELRYLLLKELAFIIEEYDVEHVTNLLDDISSVSEMLYEESRFLNGLVRYFKPKKLLEIGVTQGGSSCVLLNAIKDCPEAELYSVDLSNDYYADPSRKTGWKAKELFPNAPRWHLYTGADIAEIIEEQIGEGIEFLLLDTVHLHPAETLSFLSAFPYLTNDAIVVLHDINLAFYSSDWPNFPCGELPTYATTILLNSIVADKAFLNVFYEGFKHPNIAAFQINEDTHKYISDVFRSLFMPWGMEVPERILTGTQKLLRRKYPADLYELYERSIQQARRHQENRERLQNTKPKIPDVQSAGVAYEAKLDKVKKVIDKILKSSEQEFWNRYFILEMLKEYGICFTGWELPHQFISWQDTECDFGLLQIPSEFVDFAMYICSLGIETMVEVGVFSGASSYFLAAMLARAGKGNIEYSMVDINDNLFAFDTFSSILNVKKLVPCTSDALRGRDFDFVFIDADHSYKSVLRDYLNLGQYCRKGVAFHDIHAHEYDHQDGGVVRFWNEFKTNQLTDMTILEFTHSAKPWMGIGVGIKYPRMLTSSKGECPRDGGF